MKLKRSPLQMVATTLAISLFATANSQSAVQTVPLLQGTYNITGAKVLRPCLFEGVVTSFTVPGGPTTITDTAADFSDLALIPCAHFTIEFESGAWGTFETTFTATTVTVDQDISQYICPGDKYIIRQSNTLTSLFGRGKTLQLLGGTIASADQVLVPDGTGGINTYYYDNTLERWQDASAVDRSEDPIYIIQGMIIFRKGVDTTIALTGKAKKWPTVVDTNLGLVTVGTDFSLLSAIYDNGIGVGSCGLMSYTPHACAPASALQILNGGTSVAVSDELIQPAGGGGFELFFLFDPPGLCSDAGGSPCSADLACGFVVQHKSPRITYMLLP